MATIDDYDWRLTIDDDDEIRRNEDDVSEMILQMTPEEMAILWRLTTFH